MTQGDRPRLYALALCACLAGCGSTEPRAKPLAGPAQGQSRTPIVQTASQERVETLRAAKEISAKCEDGPMLAGQNQISEEELALPFYPGSRSLRDQKFDQNGKTTLVCVRTTVDDSATAIDFYKEKIEVDGRGVLRDADGQVALYGRLANGRKVSVKAGSAKEGGSTVSIVVEQP